MRRGTIINVVERRDRAEGRSYKDNVVKVR